MHYIELVEELNVGYSTEPSPVTDIGLVESETNLNSNLLYVPAEGIHSVITGNYTYYEPNCIKESIPLWTYPYNIPIIFHHKEHDSQIIGRVKKAEYIKESKRTNTPALGLVFGIGDKAGKEGIQNGTLSTISIGAKAVDLRCSICGQDIAKHGFCEHERGKTYDNKLCYWIVKKIVPKEVSYVIVPSDKYAYSEAPLSEKEVISISESEEDNEVNKLSKNNLFHDYLSAALAEAQEKELLGKDTKDKDVEDAKVEDQDKEKKDNEKEEESKENKDSKDNADENKDKDQDQNKDKEEAPINIKDEIVKDAIKKLEDKIVELKDEVAFFKKKYEEEAALRESAEKDKILMESNLKKDYVSKINTLRKSFGLTEKEEDLLMKTGLDVLESEYNNLSEIHNSSVNCVKTIEKLQSNSYVEDKLDNTNKESKLQESEKKTSLTLKLNNFYKR